MTERALRGALANLSLTVTFNAVPAGETKWFSFAVTVIEWARPRGAGERAFPDALRAVLTAVPATGAPPLNSYLCAARFRAAIGPKLPPWENSRVRMLTEIQQR